MDHRVKPGGDEFRKRHCRTKGAKRRLDVKCSGNPCRRAASLRSALTSGDSTWTTGSSPMVTRGGALFLLDRHAVGAEIDAHALGLLAILIELIAQADDDDQRAGEEGDDIIAIHG